MKIVALIPARGGSQRIPGKNLKLLDGLPLVAWSIVTALACPSIDKVIVSSNDSEILRVSVKFGAEVLVRPSELAGPLVPDLPVVEHLLSVETEVDLLVYLRPTTPLRATHTVEAGIQAMLEAGPGPTGLRSVHKMGESAYKCFVLGSGRLLEPITLHDEHDGITTDFTDRPEQEAPPTYKANGYVDVILPATVARGSCFGNTVLPLVTPQTLELDDPTDWDRLEWLMVTRGAKEIHEFYCRPGSRSQPWGI